MRSVDEEIDYWRAKAERLEMALEHQQQVLRQYAFSLHWGPVYGSGEQEYRMWLGPGQGWELATQALAQAPSHAENAPHAYGELTAARDETVNSPEE